MNGSCTVKICGLIATVIATASGLLTACAVGPNYRRPPFDTTTAYKESADWKPTEPGDALAVGPWWLLFKDGDLDELEAKIDVSNQNVKAAVAAVDQARALVSQARAAYYPSVNATAGRARGQDLGPTVNTSTVGASVAWTLDIWGQTRRTVESDVASAEASAAALAFTRLTAQADLATDYFQLRAQDQLQRLLDDQVVAQQKSLKITENQYKFGVAARADVVNATAQLLSTQAQQINAGVQRGVLEHAIAVLIGEQPADFSLAKTAMRSDVPTVPPGLPSTLLERRSDIAEAERKVAAANAQIGVAVAGYFPTLSLSASDQYSGVAGSLSRLISLPNRVWSVGPTLAGNLFAGGANRAEVRQARAAYDASVANYRQTVLSGLQQVEDEIVTLRVLEQQAVVEAAAVKASHEAEVLTLNQYKAGTVPYSSVITAQTTELTSEQTQLTVLSDRLQASVALIQALGGGWNTTQLP